VGAETAISNPGFFLAVKPLGEKHGKNRVFFLALPIYFSPCDTLILGTGS